MPETTPDEAKRKIANILNDVFSEIEHLYPQVHDIKSQEQWLRIIRHQDPCNNGQQLLCVAALQLPKSELEYLGKAFPKLVQAIKEYKENGFQ